MALCMFMADTMVLQKPFLLKHSFYVAIWLTLLSMNVIKMRSSSGQSEELLLLFFHKNCFRPLFKPSFLFPMY